MRKILIIAILFDCMGVFSCKKYYNFYRNNVEPGKEWTVAQSEHVFSLHPLFWIMGPGSEGWYLYSRILYKNINGKWVKWVTLEPIVNSYEGEFCDDYFQPIFWADNGFIYILNCLGFIENKDIYKTKMITTIYQVSLNKREIIARQSFGCLSGDPCYYNGNSLCYDKIFRYKLLRYNDDIILILPDRGGRYDQTWLIEISNDLSRQIKCCLIDKSVANINTDIIAEIDDSDVYIKWINMDGNLIEKSINIKDIEDGKCPEN